MGCCPVIALAVAHPETVLSMGLYWPVGGAKYRINSHQRFANHLDYVAQEGLAGVVSLATSSGKTFGEDPRVGPWASVIRREEPFAESYAKQDLRQYESIVSGMCGALYDRDTAPGAAPEDLFRLDTPTLIVPGRDVSHATSAARYLEECLPHSQYWDVLPDAQTEETAPPCILDFLRTVTK